MKATVVIIALLGLVSAAPATVAMKTSVVKRSELSELESLRLLTRRDMAVEERDNCTGYDEFCNNGTCMRVDCSGHFGNQDFCVRYTYGPC
jgi:hypothetical protein